nr:nucleotide disphospho-sugar-binding domain-containing protein [Amphritea pacifica]
MDNYVQRREQKTIYIGPCTQINRGSAASWPEGNGKKIFVYLKSEYKEIEAVIDGLVRCGYRVLVFCKGLSNHLKNKLDTPLIHLADKPLNLAEVLPEADLVINHAGIGTVLNAALYSCLQITLPIFAEQLLTAQMIRKQGVAAFLTAPEVSSKLVNTIKEILAKNYSECVNPVFAEKLKNHNVENANELMFQECLKLVNNRPI